MKPIGMMMIEHRLIEKIVPLLKSEIDRINSKGRADTDFIEKAADFFRTYADRTHHGKEEDVFFKGLACKPVSDELKKTTEELLAEHVIARKTVGALVVAAGEHKKGDRKALNAIKDRLNELVKLYPAHIEKEDKRHFFPAQEYFTREEQEKMMEEFKEFDSKMIHEKYTKVIVALQKE